MGRLKLQDSIQQVMFSFSGGNPGALNFLFELIKADEQNFFKDFMTIDKMQLYENKLYMLWNDCCKRDIQKAKKVLYLYRRGKISSKDIDERIKNVGYGQSFDDLLEGSN